MKTLGAQLGAIDSGFCEITLVHHPSLTQQHGLFHGGVVATIADNAAGFAAYTLMKDGRQPLTVEFKINLIAPNVGSSLLARAEVLSSGRRISHVRSDVFSYDRGVEALTATALVTIKSTRTVSEVG